MSPLSVRSCLEQRKPGAVINCAAYTQVDRAESDADACWQVNVTAVGTLVDICRDMDCPLVQVSTDYVFGRDTERSQPYTELDDPGPLSVYGKSKAAGEQIARTWEKHIIVRTCGLYSAPSAQPIRGRNFVDTMLSLAKERTSVRVVTDQFCTPSFVPHVAHAVLNLLDSNRFGTWHVTNQGSTTWFDFAKEVFQRANLAVTVEPISTNEYGSRARRPSYSVLDNSKLKEQGRLELPPWRQGLQDHLSRFVLMQRTAA